MTRAILLVDHGSRLDAANAQLDALAERIRERYPERLVVCAHLEIVEPNIAQAVDACAERGVREVVVHPFFLGPGRHTQRDIPGQVAEAASVHPEIRFSISEPLGLSAAVVEAVTHRIDETG